jgi:RimJ/RimL family protein N-acetyltransferase
VDPLIEPRPGDVLTERLLLRGWSERDEQQLLAMSTDSEVMRYFLRVMSAEEARTFVRRQRRLLEAGRPGLFAVETREDGRFVGFVGLAEPRFEAAFTPCVEIGWRLTRGAWGKGYATEAGRAVLAHAFGTLGLDEVVSFTAALNLPSQAVMRRLGMHAERDEDFDHPSLPEGDPLRRHVLYRLRAEKWRRGGRVEG